MYFRVHVDSTVPTPFGYIASESVERIERGAGMFETYGRAHYGLPVDREDVSTVLSDLMSDLLHFAHSRDVEPGELIERLARSFEGDFEEEAAARHGDAIEGYIECALWAGTFTEARGLVDVTESLDAHYSASDVSDEARETIARDVHLFMAKTGAARGPLDARQVGHDLYLTRNGHGAGFWDRGLGELGERLSDAAREMGESELYVGDDGRLHV